MAIDYTLRQDRGRARIKKAGIPFAIPEGEDLSARTGSVLRVIYLIFNEGYAATSGAGQIRVDLCGEAVFLARLMQGFCPEDAEVAGLPALILLSHARKNARFDENGAYIPLSNQNRALWNRGLIGRGAAVLETALARGRIGVYQLQASISALHCEAASHGETGWPQIVALYRLMERIAPGAIVGLNLAVAVLFAQSPGKGLELINNLEGELKEYQPYYAALADMFRRNGDVARAGVAYDRAIALTRIGCERAYLEQRKRTL
jgi:RNA polymerase sigma-70 factor (ECF subfamily)